MKIVIFLVLIICMQTSVLVHIHSMVGYISTRAMKFFKRFIISALSNTFIGIIIAIIVVIDREVLNRIKLDMILILESGLIFFYMLFIKATIIISIMKRMKDPANYHLSYFGKKVYEKRVVDPKEILTFVVTLPFTLFAGAYFIVKMLSL